MQYLPALAHFSSARGPHSLGPLPDASAIPGSLPAPAAHTAAAVPVSPSAADPQAAVDAASSGAAAGATTPGRTERWLDWVDISEQGEHIFHEDLLNRKSARGLLPKV